MCIAKISMKQKEKKNTLTEEMFFCPWGYVCLYANDYKSRLR